jgi:hypothetical protein
LRQGHRVEERNRHFFLNFIINHLEEHLMRHVSLGLTKLAHFYNSSRMEPISRSDEKLVTINRPVHDGELALGDGIFNNGSIQRR